MNDALPLMAADCCIVVADDHALFRKGIAMILQRGGYARVHEAVTGLEAMEAVLTHRADLGIFDVSMPQLNGIDTAREVLKRYPHARVILLTMFSEEELILEAMRAGIRGYLLKTQASGDLLAAVREVLQGSLYLSPCITQKMVEAYRDRRALPVEPLTYRERQVLQILAEGNTTRQTALLLNMSIKTVESHKAHIMRKLNIHDLAGLVRYALLRRLING